MTLNIKPLRGKVHARFISQTGQKRAETMDHDAPGKYDVIGTLLKGDNLDIPTLITYNRYNNTYYENYNATIISEMELAFGVFKTLTTTGAGRLESLRKLYAKRMPERLLALRNKVLRGDQAEVPIINDLDIPVAQHCITIDPKAPSAHDITMYDLDVLRAIASDEVVADIVPVSKGDDVKKMATEHSKLEAAMMTYGFAFRSCEPESPNFRYYAISYAGEPLYSVSNSYDAIKELTEILQQALNAAGWKAAEGRFPLAATSQQVVWHFENSDGSIAGSVNTRNSKIIFRATA